MMERRQDKLPEASCVPQYDVGSLICPCICAAACFPRRTGLGGNAQSWGIGADSNLTVVLGPGASQGALFSPGNSFLWVRESLPYGTSSGTSVSHSG